MFFYRSEIIHIDSSFHLTSMGLTTERRLIVRSDGAVSGTTTGFGPRFGKDDRVAIRVGVGEEEVEAEDDLGELVSEREILVLAG